MAQPIPEFLVWYITILGVLPCAYQYRDLFVIQMISANKRLIGDRRLSGFYRYNIKVLNLQSPRDDFLIDFDMFSRINCKVSCPFCPFWRQLSKKWLTVSSAIFSGPSSGSSCFVLQHRWRNYNASSIFILSSLLCAARGLWKPARFALRILEFRARRLASFVSRFFSSSAGAWLKTQGATLIVAFIHVTLKAIKK